MTHTGEKRGGRRATCLGREQGWGFRPRPCVLTVTWVSSDNKLSFYYSPGRRGPKPVSLD